MRLSNNSEYEVLINKYKNILPYVVAESFWVFYCLVGISKSFLGGVRITESLSEVER